MDIAVAKEIKRHEYRVAATPSCVAAYVKAGNTVRVESCAGLGAGYPDSAYGEAGAIIEKDREKLFAASEMIIKVKEPLPEEFPLFREGHILFTYLHLASDRSLTIQLRDRGIRAIAYETIQASDGSLPCLIPMSEIAGRLSIQEGAKYLEKAFGGRGILLGGIPGVPRGKVVIIGGGVVGINAAKMAVGIGAQVTILDIIPKRLGYLDDIFGPSIQTLFANDANVYQTLVDCDVAIGAVLIPGASAPKVIRREHLRDMKPGAVIVDVAVDQGGCTETTRPTTHDEPIYIVDGVVHYCVSNMPGVVALTATLGLTNQTLPYGLKIAELGAEEAARSVEDIRKGINLWDGRIVCKPVADSLQLEYSELVL